MDNRRKTSELDAVRALIRAGWVRGMAINHKGGRCLLQAITDAIPEAKRRYLLEAQLTIFLGAAIISYNDHIAKNAQQVLTMLDNFEASKYYHPPVEVAHG